MSKPFVVCQSAKDAAELCLALTTNRNSSDRNGPKPSRSDSHPRSKQREKWQKKPYSRPTKSTAAGKSAKIDGPVLSDLMVLGDSIALRLARQQQVYAPKYMKVCYGGATWQSLAQSINECKKIHQNVFLIAGTNNILKNMPVNEEVLQAVITKLKEKGVKKIYISTLPPLCKDSTKEQDIENINSLLKNLDSRENNTFVIDIFPSFLKEDDNSVNEELFEKFYYNGRQDLVHPNANGLQILANQLFDFVNSQMEST